MRSAAIVRSVREEAGLSLRELAALSGLATSTVHRIEQGLMEPTLPTLERIAQATGVRLRIVEELDGAGSLVGLGRCFRSAIADGDVRHLVRMAAALAHRFQHAEDLGSRSRMIAARPSSTGEPTWDAFLGALVEWLCVRAGLAAPPWALYEDRFLDQGWWVTPMRAMQAWEYAGSPIAFKVRGVYIHRDSLTNT